MVCSRISTLIGILINFSSINPIKALYWSAVINGVVAADPRAGPSIRHFTPPSSKRAQ
jgi:hypothetical protein